MLRDGYALTAIGAKPAFADVAFEAMRVRLTARNMPNRRPESSIDEVMATFRSQQVHPDVVPGLHALRDIGVRLVAGTLVVSFETGREGDAPPWAQADQRLTSRGS